MAAVSSANAAPNTTTLTPPTSSHGDDTNWGYREKHSHDYNGSSHAENSTKNPSLANGEVAMPTYQNIPFMGSRKMMQSTDNLHGGNWDKVSDEASSPPLPNEYNSGSTNVVDGLGLIHPTNDQHKRAAPHATGSDPEDDASKWIHRDKLAKIESQELQAAGIFIPRPRAQSKQRRDRSQSRIRRGTDASEQSRSRSRKNSNAVEQRALEPQTPTWDLRTPEEIAEEEANAYFTSGMKGGSRIPVAKASPVPIPSDFLDPSRKESPEGEPLVYAKTRSRSASGGARDLDPAHIGKRSATDTSPKKNAHPPRKSSVPTKIAASNARPKTRSGQSNRDSSVGGTRPSTRSGELKQPEGDPPWLINSYQPDPRLPPDQQLLPTVARRLQQEKWEKEGKFGDVYDKEFRPLNDNVFLKPPEAEKAPQTEETQSQPGEWPLKEAQRGPEPPKSPLLTRPGSYSTMPKITDKASPLPSPLTPTAPQLPQLQQVQSLREQQVQRVPEKPEENEEKGGCGCCVVM